MAYVEWEIKAREFGNCNCDYGCPCQFGGPPTYGDCMGVFGLQIDKGRFGETRLDGMRAALIVKWPGPVHEGNGVMQVIIDERAEGAQREALRKILYGAETEPGAAVWGKTFWNIIRSTMDTVLDPLYREIQFEVDVESRSAKLVVQGLIESTGEPIRDPVTGDEHRVRIDLPAGFEYTLAEIGRGTSKVTGEIPMELTDSYGQFINVHLSTHGIVR
jgi:hypothetical protein